MEQKTVLLVEDDETIRTLFATALTGAGIHVITASNGEDGVILALKEHPSLILMDIELPNMNGHATVAKIREDSWGRSAKVLYLTNFSEPANVVQAVSQKVEDYIVKANTPIKEIINRVRTAMY